MLRGRHRASTPTVQGALRWRRRYRVWLVGAVCGAVVGWLAWALLGGTDPSRFVDGPAGAASSAPQPDQSDLLTADSTALVPPPGATIGGLVPTPTAAAGLNPTGPPPVGPTHSPGPTPSRPDPTAPQPVLLGPDSGEQLVAMVQAYCDQQLEGSTAQPRGDGRWECQQPQEQQPRTVNMNTVCRDAYGSGAYARNPGSDPYGWRCYRSG